MDVPTPAVPFRSVHVVPFFDAITIPPQSFDSFIFSGAPSNEKTAAGQEGKPVK
jgi:hypothetical protein